MTRCQFIHAIYQQVAYERIGAGRRAQLHQRVGLREEAAYGERSAEIASELAMHFECGQDYRRAIRYCTAAGAHALRCAACKEAIAHYTRALELTSKLPDDSERARLELDLLVALGAPLAMIRGHAAPEVEEVYARARELCRRQQHGSTQQATAQHAQALMGVGAFYLVRGEYRTARALGDEFLALAGEQGDPGISLQVSLLRGMALLYLGELHEAQRELRRTIALYDPEQHQGHIFRYMQDPCVCAHSLLPLPLWIRGQSELALSHARQGLELAERLAHPAAIVLALVSLTQVHQLRGESARALELAARGRALALEHGFDLYQSTLGMLHGAAVMELGDVEAGAAEIELGWRARCRTGSELARARWRSLLALAYARVGRRSEALEGLDEAFARLQSHGDRWWEPELYCTLGELLEPQGAGAGVAVPEALAQALRALREPLPPDAGAAYRRALVLAQQTGALAFEQRAAASLARHQGSSEAT